MNNPITPEELLAALRQRDTSTEERLALVRENATVRAAVVAELSGTLQPTDHPLVRELLERELAVHEQAGIGTSETLYTLVAVLARYADPQDVLLIWRAHEATPAAHAGIDVEQALRAGIEPVRRWLRARMQAGDAEASQAAKALSWLEAGIATGAADDLPGYFAWADERFGLQVSGPT